MTSSLTPFLLLILTTGGGPEPDTLRIRTASDHPAEAEAADLLRELYQAHDFRDWLVTDEIVVDRTQIPHSHPVLTVRPTENPADFLATFLHEQFHWWVGDREEPLAAALTEFREIWPTVPVRGEGGARDEYSTYLHLAVCDLELQSVTLLLGEDVARETLGAATHYEWIYDRVLDDPRVREIMVRHGLVVR